MAIRFERHERLARYLDPRQDFAEASVACEIRRDPLTGRSGRVAHVLGFHLQAVEMGALIEASRANCPFCPERVMQVTPRFPEHVTAEGRIVRGETVVFPNLAPYDEHSAVAAISRAHYLPMDGFSPQLLGDALEASRVYLRDVQRLPNTPYGLVFWNYLPASGGTQIHPHLQLFATDAPGNTLEEERDASARYLASEGRSFWADLLDTEARLGERFIARGAHTAWLSAFVSQSLLADTLVLFPERQTLVELPDEALAEFCGALVQTLLEWKKQGVYSFNVAFYPTTPDRADAWLHARLSPRVYMTPRLWGTDTSALQHLYGEHFMVQTPEAAASALRAALRGRLEQ